MVHGRSRFVTGIAFIALVLALGPGVSVRADDGSTPAASDAAAQAAADRNGLLALNHLASLLILPPVNNAGNAAVAGACANGLKTASATDRAVRLVVYSPHMSGVQRGLNVDSSITIADVTPPFNVPARGKKLSELLGTEGYVLSTIVSEDVDTAQRTVEVKITLQAYSNGAPDPLATVTVSGGAIAASPDEDMAAVEERACQSVGRKAFYALFPSHRATSGDKRTKRR